MQTVERVPTGGMWLFVGSDRARKRERLARLISEGAIHPLDCHDVSAEQLSVRHLDELARAHPAASPRRLVVIDDAEQLDRRCVELLAGRVEGLTQTAWLVLLIDGELPASHPLSALNPLATVERFALQEPTETPNQFALVNAMAQRDAGGAVRALAEQLEMGREPLEVLGLVIWQLERWLKVAHLIEARAPQERVEALTGLKAWQVDRIRSELVGRSLALLREALRAAWDLDVAAKRGQLPVVRVSLERLVVQICLARPDRTSDQEVKRSSVRGRVTSPTVSSPVGA